MQLRQLGHLPIRSRFGNGWGDWESTRYFHAVDDSEIRHPPVDMVNIPLFTGFYTSQVMQDFSHQLSMFSLVLVESLPSWERSPNVPSGGDMFSSNDLGDFIFPLDFLIIFWWLPRRKVLAILVLPTNLCDRPIPGFTWASMRDHPCTMRSTTTGVLAA